MKIASLPLLSRRDFITLLGSAAAWPLAAWAQQAERMRRVAIMPPTTQDNPETKARLGAFREGLERLGWSEGRNIRFEYRWPGGDATLIKAHAAELVAAAPDVILLRPHARRAGAEAGEPHDPDRVHERRRPGR